MSVFGLGKYQIHPQVRRRQPQTASPKTDWTRTLDGGFCQKSLTRAEAAASAQVIGALTLIARPNGASAKPRYIGIRQME
jgi:hypothetical protein